VFYENVDDDFFQTLNWPGAPALNTFPTDPFAVNDSQRRLEQRALFGEVSWDLTKKLTATLGGRYFDYDKHERSFVSFANPGTLSDIESSESDSNFKASLSYEPTPDSLFYASWAEGFRLGRPVPGLPDSCDMNPRDGVVDGSGVSIESTRRIDSDFLENYEIGGKLAFFERRVVIDTAIYHIEWKGLPTTALAGDCLLAYTANAGAATSDGLEMQASLFVAQGLRLDFGGAYTKAELSEDAPDLGGRDGDRLPGSPEVSLNLSAQYEFDLAGHSAFVRADSLYTGKFYADVLETPIGAAGDYVKIDARAGIAFRNIGVELFVRNLTNEDAFTWRGGASSARPFFGYRLRPRTVGMQLTYSFE
jgi:iron complex outermembrane receptor protein